MICSLLLDEFYNIANSVRSIVTYKKMYMVFVSFHSYNTIAFRITDIIYLLFYIVSNRTFEYLFAVLCNKDYMHFQIIFTSVMTIVSIIHKKSPQIY